MKEKDGFAALLRQVERLLKASDRRIARYRREGRWPTEMQLRQLLVRTPLVRSRGDPKAFWRRVVNDKSFKAEGGLPALLGPMLVALAGWCLADGRRPPFFRRRARDFVELLCRRLYLMPLAAMPRRTRSTDAFFLPRLISKKTLDRFVTRLERLSLKHPERVKALMDDNPEASLALIERCQRRERGHPSSSKRHAQTYPAHAELVHEVRLLMGRLFCRELAAFITAAHHAHGNENLYVDERALARAYRRWLKAIPEEARVGALVGHVKDGLLLEILR